MSTSELEQYSDCRLQVEKTGDVINQTSEFSISGNLTRRLEVPAEEVMCTPRLERRTLNIHVPFLSFDLAKMACDKYAMNSMVGPFLVSMK